MNPIGDEYAGRVAAVEQKATSAHHRLDGINGQIARQARATEALVEKMNDDRIASSEARQTLWTEFSAVKAKLGTLIAILSVIGTAIIGALATTVVVLIQKL